MTRAQAKKSKAVKSKKATTRGQKKSSPPPKPPSWNLADLYKSPDSPQLKADLKKAARDSKMFQKRYKGTLSRLSGKELGQAIAEYEKISERLDKIMSYAQLLHAAQVSDSKITQFYQSTHEKITTISTDTLFFTLELNRLKGSVLKKQLKNKKAAKYEPWIRDVRVFRSHQLSDELEKFVHEKSVTGKAAWVRLYDETLAALRFPLGRKRLTLSEVLNLMSHPKAEQRRSSAKILGEVLGENLRTFALVTNTLAKDKEIDDSWRQYAHPAAARNLSNQVEDDVVEALVKAVKAAYPTLAHRYYGLKARWFGGRQLNYWDRNAPIPGDRDQSYTWTEAKSMVLEAYGQFAAPMADIAEEFFRGRWIDAPPCPGKDSGAFSHPTVPSVHPYILMNFYGKSRDVMTLAHELGHGVHQVLSANQGALMADTPLTTAETASVFGEMLTFRAMLDRENNAKRRRFLLAGKVEDMLNTVVRQIAFHEFERYVHGERKAGEISAERLGEIWMKVQRESLGPALKFDKEYSNYWAYIPHFIHSPFYVYAYAFGDCLVNSLYDVFQGGHPKFQHKYLDMLRAGGTKRHKELLAPFGLDASDPKFWRRGLSVIEGFVDELEKVS